MRRRSRRADAGMTLLEIMIVLALIALIMSAVGVVVHRRFVDGQVRTAQIEIRKMQGQMQQFMFSRNHCPSVQDLVAAHYVRAEPRDPWGGAYAIKCPGERDPDGIDMISLGPDKTEGTEDDIKSWELR